MSENKTPTPRTDKAIYEAEDYYHRVFKACTHRPVHAYEMAQLEQELQSAQAEIGRLRACLEDANTGNYRCKGYYDAVLSTQSAGETFVPWKVVQAYLTARENMRSEDDDVRYAKAYKQLQSYAPKPEARG